LGSRGVLNRRYVDIAQAWSIMRVVQAMFQAIIASFFAVAGWSLWKERGELNRRAKYGDRVIVRSSEADDRKASWESIMRATDESYRSSR
jgi:hypothetical protein